jgi:hypothetical protein
MGVDTVDGAKAMQSPGMISDGLLEQCDFGKTLETGMIKHTNLTGGAPAYSGGEFVMLGDIMVVSGSSGRYGPRSADEMCDVAQAFSCAGYSVWHMGYDPDADWALPFDSGAMPQPVP